MKSKAVSLRPHAHNLQNKPNKARRSALGIALTLVVMILVPTAFASITFTLKWGTSGTANGEFLTPAGINVDSAGNIYVAEGNGNRVQKFDNNGTFIRKFGFPGDVDGGFVSPSGVAVDAVGRIYVTDQFTNRVSKFDSTGIFLTTWGGTGSGSGKFLAPSGVAVDSAGDIYVSDTNNHRIEKFDSGGVFIMFWGSNGSGDGELSTPAGLAIDSADNVYVADTGNNRIQKFDMSGNFITKWGTAGSGNGEFTGPTGVSVNASGTVVVADNGNSRIQTFTNTGTFQESFGSNGTGDGQFSGPQGVAVDVAGNIFVADTGNDRVQKLGAASVVADAGPDQTVECAGATTPVTLNGTASTGGSTLSYTWKEGASTLGTGAVLGVSLPAGTHTIVLTVASGGASNDDTVLINVVDTAAPTITLNGANPMTVECHTVFTDPGATASDGCAGNLTGSISVTGSVNPNAVGTYVRTYSVSDGARTVSRTRTVNVVDTIAPVITLNGNSPTMRPPDHDYHIFRVTDFVTAVGDSCDSGSGVSAVVIAKVTSDEAEDSHHDGHTVKDIVIAPGCRSVKLRAERDGRGNGRVYTITFRVKDAAGNTRTATAKVTVPKHRWRPAVDDGPHYTVLGSCP